MILIAIIIIINPVFNTNSKFKKFSQINYRDQLENVSKNKHKQIKIK
jgi:hypothetical protein